nr:hypothetical protein [Roseococcus sp. SYP-B2431]
MPYKGSGRFGVRGAVCSVQEGCQIAAQRDGQLAAALARKYQDRVDQPTQGFGCRHRRRRIRQGCFQPLDMAAVEPRQVRMQGWHQLRHARCDNLGPKRFLPTLQVPQFRGHRHAAMAVLEQLKQIPNLPGQFGPLLFQPGTAGADVPIGGVHLGDVGVDELLDQFGCQQALLEANQDPAQQYVPQQGARIAAGSPFHMVRTAQPALAAHHRQQAMAHPAAHQAGKRPGWPARRGKARPDVPRRRLVCGSVGSVSRAKDAPRVSKPTLSSLPNLGIYDGQFRRGADDPGFARIRPRHPFAGVRILDEALPVPHPLADIEPVAQQAGFAAGAAQQE